MSIVFYLLFIVMIPPAGIGLRVIYIAFKPTKNPTGPAYAQLLKQALIRFDQIANRESIHEAKVLANKAIKELS